MGRRAKGRSGLRLAHPAEGVALGVAGLLVAATLTISLGGLPDLPGQETSVTTASDGSPGAAAPAAPAGQGPTIERLLADGWEIVGLAGNYDVRTSLILFRKKDMNYLVQCSTLFDVTRERRVVVNCYELR